MAISEEKSLQIQQAYASLAGGPLKPGMLTSDSALTDITLAIPSLYSQESKLIAWADPAEAALSSRTDSEVETIILDRSLNEYTLLKQQSNKHDDDYRAMVGLSTTATNALIPLFRQTLESMAGYLVAAGQEQGQDTITDIADAINDVLEEIGEHFKNDHDDDDDDDDDD